MSFEVFQEKIIDLFQNYDKSVLKEKGVFMQKDEIILFLEWIKETFPIDRIYIVKNKKGEIKKRCDWKYMINETIKIIKYLH